MHSLSPFPMLVIRINFLSFPFYRSKLLPFRFRLESIILHALKLHIAEPALSAIIYCKYTLNVFKNTMQKLTSTTYPSYLTSSSILIIILHCSHFYTALKSNFNLQTKQKKVGTINFRFHGLVLSILLPPSNFIFQTSILFLAQFAWIIFWHY